MALKRNLRTEMDEAPSRATVVILVAWKCHSCSVIYDRTIMSQQWPTVGLSAVSSRLQYPIAL